MCGRFTQTKSREDVLEQLEGIELPPLFQGRYNIAPMQEVALMRRNAPIESFLWGFQNPHSGAPIINARSETLTERPMFKHLVNTNYCLIPADGFYEWKGRQPYYFQLPNQQLFAFAGLWHKGRCVIITRTADQNMQGIHDRMPIILPQNRWHQWLEHPHSIEPPTLTARPVSRSVNKVINDSPACIEPEDEQLDLSLFPAGD